MIKNERQLLMEEISLILSKCVGDDYGYFDDKELINLRNALQPAVEGWNDAEYEYQSLVDSMGDGINEYNYNNYIPNREELKLLKKIENQKVDTYFCYMPTESVEKIFADFIEHRTGAKLECDAKHGVIKIIKNL